MSDAMISIRLTHGTHTVLSTGKTYSAGDVFPGTETMLAGLIGKAVKAGVVADLSLPDNGALAVMPDIVDKVNKAVAADNPKPKDSEVVRLRIELDELGVSYHGRSGAEKLKQQLEEAKANADQQAPSE